ARPASIARVRRRSPRSRAASARERRRRLETLGQARGRQRVERSAAANGIGDRKLERGAGLFDEARGLGLSDPGRVEADAAAADRGVGAGAEAERQIDRLSELWQLVAGKAQHLRARGIVAEHDDVRLTAVQ